MQASVQADFFTRRGILVHRAPWHVLEKAREIVTALEQGTPYWKLHGKRLRRDRLVISIPVGRRWRLLALDHRNQTIPRVLLSHAQYDGRGHRYLSTT